MVIVETGCQRMPDDLGAGMSSSIFGQFCQENNGRLYTVDISPQALDACRACTRKYASHIDYNLSDSLQWLEKAQVTADLAYLDSYDYPYGEILNFYGGREDITAAEATVKAMTQEQLIERHGDLIIPCQEHTLNEFIVAERSGVINKDTIVMTDDNQLPGGGKPRILKDHLLATGWTCLFDHQQSLWINLND